MAKTITKRMWMCRELHRADTPYNSMVLIGGPCALSGQYWIPNDKDTDKYVYEASIYVALRLMPWIKKLKPGKRMRVDVIIKPNSLTIRPAKSKGK